MEPNPQNRNWYLTPDVWLRCRNPTQTLEWVNCQGNTPPHVLALVNRLGNTIGLNPVWAGTLQIKLTSLRVYGVSAWVYIIQIVVLCVHIEGQVFIHFTDNNFWCSARHDYVGGWTTNGVFHMLLLVLVLRRSNELFVDWVVTVCCGIMSRGSTIIVYFTVRGFLVLIHNSSHINCLLHASELTWRLSIVFTQ